MIEELSSAGLTASESRIYYALIEAGKAQAGAICRKTGIHRRNVYDVLERLIEKGLASFIKENGKRFYIPAEPKCIIEAIDAKKSALLSVLPMLESKFNAVREKQETLFFRGIEGVKAIFDDQLAVGKDILAISPANQAKKYFPFYIKHFTKARIEKKMKLKIIYAGGQKGKKLEYAEVRHLPKQYESPITLNVCGEKVAIIIWGVEPAAVQISNSEVAKAFRGYFSMLWEMACRQPE